MQRNKGTSLLDFPANFTAIDIETTGLDSRFDEIIELSGIKVRDGKPIDQFSTLVNPLRPVSDFITGLTGITSNDLEQAPTLDEVLEQYIAFIGDDVVVGHNVSFDINFIYDKRLQLAGKEFSNNFVDTLRLARFLLRDMQHHRLRDIVEHYNISSRVEHRGITDAAAALDVFNQLQMTALEQYDSIEQLTQEFKRRANHPHPGLKASSIVPNGTEFDVTHPIYGQCFVFTGALERMIRKEAFQTVVDHGGIVQDGINKETNFLVVGSLDYSKSIKNGKSGKLKRAEELILKGRDLAIISENVFYDILEKS